MHVGTLVIILHILIFKIIMVIIHIGTQSYIWCFIFGALCRRNILVSIFSTQYVQLVMVHSCSLYF